MGEQVGVDVVVFFTCVFKVFWVSFNSFFVAFGSLCRYFTWMGEQGEVDFFGCLCQFVWVVFGSSLQFCCFLLVSVSSFWYLPGWASKFGSSTLEKTCRTDAIWGRTHLKDFELEANWQSRTRDLIYKWTKRSIIKQDANFSISVRSLWLLCLLFSFSEASTTLALGSQDTTNNYQMMSNLGLDRGSTM